LYPREEQNIFAPPQTKTAQFEVKNRDILFFINNATYKGKIANFTGKVVKSK